MKAYLGSLMFTALFPATIAFASTRSEVVVKCAQVIGPVVYVLDGMIVEEGVMADYTRGSRITAQDAVNNPEPKPPLKSLLILCSDESHRVFGVEPGRSMVLAWTQAVPPVAFKASVESIAPLQEAYFARNGVYASRLADLRWSDPSASIAVRLCISEDGKRWNALGWQASPSHTYPGVLVMGADLAGKVAGAMRYSCQVAPSPAA